MLASRKEDSGSAGLNDFVKKLFQMLLQDQYMDVVRWTAQGNSFVVLNTNEFTKEILPRHFKHSNFASFVRQLNKYDFHKVKISNEEKQTYEYGEDAWEFQHPDFRKDDRDALENIRRKAPLKKEPAVQLDSRYVTQVLALRLDLTKLQLEHKVLLDKYRAVLESMVAFRTFNERQYRLIGLLVHSLNQAGIKVPPLDLPNPNLLRLVPSPTVPAPQVPLLPEVKLEPDSGSIRNLPEEPPATHLRSHSESVAQQPPPFEPITTQLVPNPKFHVLLVEDDNVCIQLCRKFLMKYGCLVTVVTDGLNAISTLERNRYDLVLMDIVMPNLDGASATSVIRGFDTKTPIIAMTGNIEDNDLVTYLQTGMSDILAKPFTKEDLYLILSKHLLGNNKDFPDQPPVAGYLSLPLENGQQPPIEPLPIASAMPHISLNIAQMNPPLMESIEPMEQPQKKQRMH